MLASTALAGVLAGSGIASFYWGLIGYSASVAVLSSIAFGCLIGTLIIIKRNLVALNEIRDPRPLVEPAEKPRPSFAAEDINALKDGSSWITSRASSYRDSVSAWSFTTHHTQHSRMPSNTSSKMHVNHALGSHSSIPPKSSYWFNPVTGRETKVPPVPPLPAPYRPSSAAGFTPSSEDPDPFRRNDPRPRLGSQSSWLTEPSTYQPTISAWSFPPTPTSEGSIANYPYPSTPDLPNTEFLMPHAAISRHSPAMVSPFVLGGYGYSPEAAQAEKGASSTSSTFGTEVDVSVYRAIGWLFTIWVPLALALPFYLTVHKGQPSSAAASILLILSVTSSAPLLALNIFFRSPLPIPSGLFDTPENPPTVVMRAPSPLSTSPSLVYEYKRSGSVTVVEGRRSGDVWITNGDAVEGKSKMSRAFSLLQAKPKLSVLPPGTEYEHGKDTPVPMTPPLPIQDPSEQGTVPPSPQFANDAEMGMRDSEIGMRKKDSKASCWSSADNDGEFSAQVMVAQKHYSTLAMTMVFPPSPTSGRPSEDIAVTTAVDAAQSEAAKPSGSHLRTRSVTSISSQGVQHSFSTISPPPASPLPPTPPTLKNFRAKLGHRRSYSSINEFSFGAIENDCTREIDALSAGIVPLLLPEMRIGKDMRITGEWKMSPSFEWGGMIGKETMARHSRVPSELGGVSGELSSPQFHSTPNIRKGQRDSKSHRTTGHKRHHFSLPSLSLEKDDMHSLSTWSNEINHALDNKENQYTAIPDIAITDEGRTISMYDGAYPDTTYTHLNAVREEDEALRPASPVRPISTTGFPETLDVPHSVDSTRNSMATLISALDQELHSPLRLAPQSFAASDVTLFDFNPGADGLGESTPLGAQGVAGRRSTDSNRSRSSRVPPLVSKITKKTKAERRSSIKYIRSDENTPSAAESSFTSATSSKAASTTGIVEWSRFLPKKSSKAQLRAKQNASAVADQENEPPSTSAQKVGLRSLALLQDRDAEIAQTRPLTIGKKNKNAPAYTDENAPPKRESSLKKGLRPLRLNRNDTTKERAALRERETIPEVVVRPPSLGYAHGFR
ncbi:hypothetical protein EIP86_003953 [Pleurotus ostreatoroseus]|nr:hypothetical protein EIP86_003953 [Pleurotus ostreatoroseus]